ncbi:hypothetical protein HDU76_005208, partial [Blyttiomyces sp. JEL0837]
MSNTANDTSKRIKLDLDDGAISSKLMHSEEIKTDEQTKLDALLKWAQDNGANVSNIQPANTPLPQSNPNNPDTFIRGALAHSDLEGGSVIGYLPQNLILSESTARASTLGRAIVQYMHKHPDECKSLGGGTDPYAPGLVLLASFLAHERFAPPSTSPSFWHPYLNSLPLDFGLPISWPDDQVNSFLSGTSLAFIVRERRKLLQDAVDLVHRACTESNWQSEYDQPSSGKFWKLTYEELVWGYSVIASRAFPGKRSKDGDETIAEGAGGNVEGSDALNHNRNQKIEWNTVVKPGITFITPDPIQNGQIMWNNYGSKGNENFLSNYGFVLDPNPEDYHKVALNITQSDPLHHFKISALTQLPTRPGLVHLLFHDDHQLPVKFTLAAMVLVGNEREIDRIMFAERAKLEESTTSTNSKKSGDEKHMVSVMDGWARCIIATLTTLWQLLRSKRSGISEIEVAKRWDAVQAERYRMAEIYRR